MDITNTEIKETSLAAYKFLFTAGRPCAVVKDNDIVFRLGDRVMVYAPDGSGNHREAYLIGFNDDDYARWCYVIYLGTGYTDYVALKQLKEVRK